jgi:hypothetical protein
MRDKARIKQGTENDVVIIQDTEDSRLQILLKDYELQVNRLNGFENQLIQFMSIIFGILAVVATYFLSQQATIPVELAWIAPIFSILLVTFLLFTLYEHIGNMWNARFLARRINKIFNEKVLINFDPEIPSAWLLSTKRGNLKTRLMYSLLFSGCVLIFVFMSFVSFRIVYERASHLIGSLFVLFYAVLVIALLISVSGFLWDLPNAYRDFFNQFPNAEALPADFKFKPSISATGSNAFITIIPRVPDFITKSVFFIFGFVTALVVVGLQQHLVVVSSLFSTAAMKVNGSTIATSWKNISDVPIWAIWAFGALCFCVEEILLQQAKLMWDDIRDVEYDRAWFPNNTRPIASGRISVSSATWQMLVRWMLAFGFGYLLGGVPLLLVFLIISLHQVIYTLWAKPESRKKPHNHRRHIVLLLVLSFNFPLRFLAGVIAVVGPQWLLPPFILLFVSFYLCAVGVLALQWKLEAQHQQDLHQNVAVRPQSEFYLQRGEHWQHVGLVGAILITSLLVLIHFISKSCNTGLSLLQQWYGSCNPNNGIMTYADKGFLYNITLIFALITLSILLAAFILRLLRKLEGFIIKALVKVKTVLVILLSIISISAFLFSVMLNNVSILFLGFLIFNMLLLVMYERMTYLQYTLVNLRKRLPWIFMAWHAYLFRPLPGLGMKELLVLTFTDVDLAKLKSIFPNRIFEELDRKTTL